MSLLDLAPAADVFVPQFHEVNRTVEFGPPGSVFDPALIPIDLHERARTDERIHREIAEADVTVHGFTQVQVLDQPDRNLPPNLHQPAEQRRFIELQLLARPQGKHDLLNVTLIGPGDEMRFPQPEERLIAADVARTKPEERDDIRPAVPVDDTEAVKLVDAGRIGAVLHIVQPSAGDEEIPVLFVFGKLQAARFHLAQGEREMDA